jgi:hypothetical protein
MRTRLLILFSLLLVCGCAHPAPPLRQGPTLPAPVQVEHGDYAGAPAWRVTTPHYVVYSTISDEAYLAKIGELMEGALGQYRHLAGDVPLTDKPMECYLFATRKEWAEFTRTHTGDDAAVYLRVNRGGYTVGDWYVAYFIGEIGTCSVAAHEGWHQFVARHLQGRLPPFLEEGFACLFEEVQWDGDLPRWDLTSNTSRLSGLRNAAEHDRLVPLEQLIRMHAGQVVGHQPGEIEAFYAQGWAFARFLWDAEKGKYRHAVRAMLADAAAGNLFADSASRAGAPGPFWDPRSAKPMLEHYLGTDLARIDGAYQGYVRRLTAGTVAADE